MFVSVADSGANVLDGTPLLVGLRQVVRRDYRYRTVARSQPGALQRLPPFGSRIVGEDLLEGSRDPKVTAIKAVDFCEIAR